MPLREELDETWSFSNRFSSWLGPVDSQEKNRLGFNLCEVCSRFDSIVTCALFIEVKNSEEQYNKIVIPNEENVVIYYKIRQQLAKLGKEIEEYIHKPKYCLPFLQPGRLVKVRRGSVSGICLLQMLKACLCW